MLWGRSVLPQDLQTLLRCHTAAFEALGGVPEQTLYDRMRSVLHREDPDTSHIVYNRTLLAFASYYGYLPKACKAYRAKTKGKVERPLRYIREDFFLGRSFATSMISHVVPPMDRPSRQCAHPRHDQADCRRTFRRGAPSAAAADRGRV